MNFLWDTNILVHYLRRSPKYIEINRENAFFDAPNQVFISIISVAEIESLALQLKWGSDKWAALQLFINAVKVLDIYEETIHTYAKLDAFSQGKLDGFPLPLGMTARNMGKNNLWLAATASVGKLTFVTMDADFAHLDGFFIDLLQV